jgi:ribonuclease P protein component
MDMTEPLRPRLTLLKREHLRSPRDFRRVYDRRCSAQDRWLLVFACPNEFNHLRLGMSVSRKVGNAVARNRLRRLYREAFRLSRVDMPKGLDLVLIPRSNEEPSLDDLRKSLPALVGILARRLGQQLTAARPGAE